MASERHWGSADVTGASLHVLRLGAHLLGFYEGRTPGIGDDPAASWVEDGALSLGICSYALVDGSEAIVYDTHVSVDRARTIRRRSSGSACAGSGSS